MKKHVTKKNMATLWRVAISLSALFAGASSHANPKGVTVVSGSATTSQHGNTLQITTGSHNTFLQWNSFNIAPGQTTIFKEPSVNSIVFNYINNANPSKIFGSLQANGIVVLENQNGFYFGPNAMVKTGGLVLTTAAINPWASAGGAGWAFDGPPVASPIVNYGHLETTSGGSIFLIAKEINNQGTIEAPGGKVGLIAGQEVLLAERADGLSLAAPVKLPAGSVNNAGEIVADAGQVLLQAQTVNNSGLIEANSVRQKNGVIELFASRDVQLSGTSALEANGDDEGISSGGKITIKSGGTFSDNAGSQISVAGGTEAGAGGEVEVSAQNVESLNSSIDAKAQPGWGEGWFMLDPTAIELGSAAAGTIQGADYMNVNTAFQNVGANILLQAQQDITLDSGTTWDLSASTGAKTGQLTLQAGGNINIGGTSSAAAKIVDANDWSLTLDAGYNFAANGGVVPGVGSLTLNGASAIALAAGNINILAGDNVSVGSSGIVTGIANGAVMGSGGGNISVQAVSGNIACGSSLGGYLYTATGAGYVVSPTLGGISTASGGNVTLTAGGNITSVLETGQSGTEAGAGAYGATPGNVTLTAGGEVTGHYVVADGVGVVTAANAGFNGTAIALSLIKGGWLVNAADNILLQEVRNPNGMFNSSTLNGGQAPTDHLYNYDPSASVMLNAGDGVTITGSGPRTSGANEGLIFPPILDINAGSGGITLDASVNLYPSPLGTLDLTTTGGGSLGPKPGSTAIVNLCLSDSEQTSWQGNNSFTPLDPGNNALHLHDPNPVALAISGNVSDINLYSPKVTDMIAGGNIVNSGAFIKNLLPTDTSVISAGGYIKDYSSYVLLTLQAGQAPNFNALAELIDPYLNAITGAPVATQSSLYPTVANPNYNPTEASILTPVAVNIGYDAATKGLLFKGVMSQAEETALLGLKNPFLSASVVQQIYQQSQLESSKTLFGFQIAGPGTLQINAASLDLGNSLGVVSLGIDGFPQDAPNSGLAPYTQQGANIDISVSGNLEMISSTIESEYGGAINIRSGGEIDVGSALVPASSAQHPLGIVSLWQGNLNIVAQDDIDVEGSRIAAYDGGNVFVESLTGDVNAGVGGSGSVLVTKPFLHRGQVEYLPELIPGSGILATSFPQLVPGETSEHVGDITVDTPEGDIIASRGGIAQLALAPGGQNDGIINLSAGTKNSDGTVEDVGSVDAAGSGIVGGQVIINATGNIEGLVVASVSASVVAVQNANVTVISQGTATVSAGGTVSGTIVGVGNVAVSGAADVAATFSASGTVTASGAISGAAVAAAPTGSSSASTAATAQQATQATQSNATAATDGDDDNDPLKKKKRAQLMEYVGRVTVLLPE